jgi:hypothetical protein
LTLLHKHDGSGLEHPRDEYEVIMLLKHVCPQDGRALMAGSVVLAVVEVCVALVDTLLEVVDVDEVSKTDEDLVLVREEVEEVTLLQSPHSGWLHLWISRLACIYSGRWAVTYHPTPQSATEEPHMPSLLQQNP